MNPSLIRSSASTLRLVWNGLTQPSAELQQPEQRRQAQFLAALLLVLVPIAIASMLIADVFTNCSATAKCSGVPFTLIGLLVGAIAYWMSRTRHYGKAAFLIICVAFVLIIVWIAMRENGAKEGTILFLLVPVLLSSILLSLRSTAIILVMDLVALFVIAAIRPDIISLGVLSASSRYLAITGTLTLLAMGFRNQIALDHQVSLQQANANLEARAEERAAAYRKTATQLLQLIAEREQWEKRLSDERNLLRTVIDNIPDHIFAIDREGRYILANAHYSQTILSEAPAAILGQVSYDLIPPELAQQYRDEERALMESGESVYDREQTHAFADETRNYSISKIPLLNSLNTVTGLIGIAHDITQRKRYEAVLQSTNSELEDRVQLRTAELLHTNDLLRQQVAERQQAEEQLRYQANLLENVSDAIISLDRDLMIRSWNRASEIIFEQKASSILGKPISHLSSFGISGELAGTMLKDVLDHGTWHGELPHTRSDGTQASLLASATPLKNEDETIIGLVIVSRDVTESKRIEAAEREQRLLAEALRDTVSAINSSLDLQQILDQILRYIERVIPYDSASVLLIDGEEARFMRGRHFEKYGTPITALESMQMRLDEYVNLQQMYESGRPILVSDTHNNPHWAFVSPITQRIRAYVGAPIRIEDRVIGFVNLDSNTPDVFTQIDAQKLQAFADQAAIAIHNARLFEAINSYAGELEQHVALRTDELERERAQLEAILNSMHDGVHGIISGDHIEQFGNAALTRLTGCTAEEWLLQMITLSAEHADEDNQLSAISEQVEREGVWQGDRRIRRKDGTEFDARLTVTRIASPDKRSIGMVTLVHDISQEKVLEQQKSLFVANASHELRTPITNLITRLYLIRKRPEHIDKHLDVIDQTARRMRNLVEDLLDYSRFERGVIPLSYQQLDLRDLIAEVVNVQQIEAEQKVIRIDLVLPSDRPLIARVDRERFIQVITNLVVNAIHYTEQGGSIRLSAHLEDQHKPHRQIIIEVSDSGVGIAPDALPNLFMPFFRASENTKGTGLGLSIAREIIKAHDGEISVQSQQGIGSQFTIRLPLASEPG